MSIQEIAANGGGVLLLVFTLIQIAPVKINPWTWFGKVIGRLLNGEVLDKVDELGKDVHALRAECEEREATNARTRILRFGDEILHGKNHSKEHFDQILLDITAYEDYCKLHRDFQNNVAVATIERIKQVYRKCMDDNSFL